MQSTRRARGRKRKFWGRNNGFNSKDNQELIALGSKVENIKKLIKLQEISRGPVVLSNIDKADELIIDNDVASSSGGYRTVRATHGAFKGCWYFEVSVQCLGRTGAVRLGWSKRTLNVDMPVGSVSDSYGYRSLDGTKISHGERQLYGGSFCNDFVIGCLINLGSNGRSLENSISDIIQYKGQYYYRRDDSLDDKVCDLEGSYVEFFLNGISQGKAYENLKEGRYYPTVSLFSALEEETTKVQVNFGSKPFQFLLPLGSKPFSDMSSVTSK